MVKEHQPQHESQWAAIVSIAAKMAGRQQRCVAGSASMNATPATAKASRRRSGSESRTLRESRELRQAVEILRKASAYFAQAELDRRFKP